MMLQKFYAKISFFADKKCAFSFSKKCRYNRFKTIRSLSRCWLVVMHPCEKENCTKEAIPRFQSAGTVSQRQSGLQRSRRGSPELDEIPPYSIYLCNFCTRFPFTVFVHFLYKISRYSLPWCSFCRFPFASRAIFGICICGNTRFPFIYSTWATF